MTVSRIHLITKISPETLSETTDTEAAPQNCGIIFSRERPGHLHLNNVLVLFVNELVAK